MAAEHADAVRSYLDYLCRRPGITEADGWRNWVARALAGPATVGLSIGILGSACAPEDGFEGGTGGQPIATGGVATGGVVPGSGGAYGLVTGGHNTGGRASGGVATGGVVSGSGGAYAIIIGGSNTGGRASGGVVLGGVGSGGKYGLGGLLTGGKPAGGRGTGLGGTASGGAGGIGVRYGVPMGGI